MIRHPGSGCMDGWKYINTQCFRHVTIATNLHWYDAHDACQSYAHGSNLATIRSQREMNLIQEYILTEGNPTHSTYIGLTLNVDENRHIWDSGYPMTYTDWQVAGSYENRQPDGGDLERCTTITFWSYRETSNWHDIPCAAYITNQFICQMEVLSNDTVTQPTSLEITKDSLPMCTEGQFHCFTGECVLSVYVCNSQVDCADGSDELNCTKLSDGSCSVSEFSCKDGGCIPASFFCDFVQQCTDGSDENECVYSSCSSDDFRCSDDLCIPLSKECDLITDCIDGSDEAECASSVGNFQCFSGKLLPSYTQCDGYRDCSGKNWEDEPESCGYLQDTFHCDASSQLQCRNGACTEYSSRCLFEYDKYGYLQGCRDASHVMECESFSCPADYFKCPTSYCIPERSRCDGELDCQYGEDELNCELYTCAPGSYKCHGNDNRVCIPQKDICDGIVHCHEGDDELFCEVRSCIGGCDCSGMSFICSATEWRPDLASQLPAKARQLILRDMNVVEPLQRRGNDNASTSAVAIEDALFIDMNRFQFVLDIDFSGNGIEILLDYEFMDNTNLRNLILDENLLISLSNKTFSGLINLRYLSLKGNPLTTVGRTPFESMGALVTLDLRSTDLTDFSDEIFLGLDSLEQLFSDKFFFCCLFEQIRELDLCVPEAGQFSSCQDLMRNRFLRISLWVLGVAALLGNGIVIFLRIYRREILPNSHRNPTQSILITNLALADLFTGMYMMIIAMADFSYRNVYYRYSEIWQTGGLCKFSGFLAVLGSEGSVMFLTVITIDRFQGIISPLSRRKLRFKSSYIISGLVWLFAVIISFTPLLPLQYFGVSFYGRSSVCLALPLTRDFLPGWLYSVFLFLVLNFVCFIAMLVFYIIIYIKAKQSVGFKKSSSLEKQSRLEEQVQMAAKMSFLVITDMICWMPIVLMGCLALSGAIEIPGDMYAVTAVFILPVNSALNPYLYTLFVKAAKRGSINYNKPQAIGGANMTSSTGTTSSTRAITSTETTQQEMLQNLFSSFRRSRLIVAMNISPIQKYTLKSLLEDGSYKLSKMSVNDIASDIRKGLQCLHDNGIVHGNITTSSVVIVGEVNNKRGFLVYLSSWQNLEKSILVISDSFDDFKRKDWHNLEDVIVSLNEDNA